MDDQETRDTRGSENLDRLTKDKGQMGCLFTAGTKIDAGIALTSHIMHNDVRRDLT